MFDAAFLPGSWPRRKLPQDNQLRIISKPVDAEELLALIRLLTVPQ